MRYPDGAVGNGLPYRRDQNGQQDGLAAKVNRNDVTQVRVK